MTENYRPTTHQVTVNAGRKQHILTANDGANLRQLLIDSELSPYATLTKRANCGGRGLCATCGVWVEPEIEPTHWHDKAALAFGYPRLTCQISVEQDMVVTLLDNKLVWGSRQRRALSFNTSSR